MNSFGTREGAQEAPAGPHGGSEEGVWALLGPKREKLSARSMESLSHQGASHSGGLARGLQIELFWDPSGAENGT